RLDLALEVAEEAARCFPLLPGAWLDLAQVHRLRERGEDEVAACERAMAVNPGFARAVLMLSAAWTHQARPDQSLAALDRGLRHSPLATTLLVARGDLQWRAGQRADAIASVRRAMEVDPTDAESWQRLLEW